MKGEKLKKNLNNFLTHIDAIRDTLPMTLLLLGPHSLKANRDLIKFLKNNIEEIEDDNGEKKLLVKAEESSILDKLEKNASISSLAHVIIPESLFVSLISQYDAFLNRLLRALFEIVPEILNSSERNLTFSQLIKYESLDDARNYIIEKEVDTVLRKNHSEQFDYLENKLGMKLRVNLPIWKNFIEITERRNLLVHCDGKVSNQYIKNCNEHNCKIDKINIDDKLKIDSEYFFSAYRTLYEIAVKLTHSVWRKVLNSDLKNADENLNDICFDLLSNKTYELADILLGFGINQKKHFNDALKNVFYLNGALSKYLQNKKTESQKILDKKDWSACSDDFKLAFEILTEDYKSAYSTMIKIGDNGHVDKTDYREWPIFLKIREEKEFKKVFKSIFKDEYSILETPKRPVQELINEEIKKSKTLKEKTVKKEKSKKEKEKEKEKEN
jgi:hypothetical protein